MELLGLSAMLAASVLVPLVLGLVVDGALHSSPVGVMAGLLLGIFAACLAVYKRFKRYW
jgi:F0F1-type ATP synthase assembly protein I